MIAVAGDGIIRENLPSWKAMHKDDPSKEPEQKEPEQKEPPSPKKGYNPEEIVRSYSFKIEWGKQTLKFTTIARSGKEAIEHVEKYFQTSIALLNAKPIKVSKPCRIGDISLTREEIAKDVEPNTISIALRGSNNDLSWPRKQKSAAPEGVDYIILPNENGGADDPSRDS